MSILSHSNEDHCMPIRLRCSGTPAETGTPAGTGLQRGHGCPKTPDKTAPQCYFQADLTAIEGLPFDARPLVLRWAALA